MLVTSDYRQAHAEAQRIADESRREMGIETAKEYGKKVYRVKHLPVAAKR